MTKKTIIDIDAEFDDVFFDEKRITFETSAKLRTQDPKWIKKITAINQARAQDPEALAKHRATMQSDEYKQAHRAGMTNEYRELKSQQTRDLWADPEFRALQEQRLSDPEVKAKQQAAARKREDDPDYQRRKKEWSSKFKDNTERSAKLSKSHQAYQESLTPEARLKISERAKLIASTRTKEDYEAIHAKRLSGDWHANIIKAGKKKMKPLLTPDQVFGSKKEAHLHYGFDPAMIDYNRKKKPNEWFFITVEDYEKCLTNPRHINKLRKLRLAGEYEEPK